MNIKSINSIYKKFIEKVSYKNKLILVALIFVAFLLAGIKFFNTDFLKNTPKEQEQVQPTKEIPALAPIVRKDTYTISSENPPYFTWASFDPLAYKKGETQVVEVKIENEIPVDEVKVTMITDNYSKTYELELIEGTTKKGTWRGSWVVQDSYDSQYQAELYAKNESEESKVVVSFR